MENSADAKRHDRHELALIAAPLKESRYAGQPGLEVTPGKQFFDVANNGQPFLKNWDKYTNPPDDALTFHAMPPVKGAITVNIGASLCWFCCYCYRKRVPCYAASTIVQNELLCNI